MKITWKMLYSFCNIGWNLEDKYVIMKKKFPSNSKMSKTPLVCQNIEIHGNS